MTADRHSTVCIKKASSAIVEDIFDKCGCRAQNYDPDCGSDQLKHHKIYQTVHNGSQELHQCKCCGNIFSETRGTPMQDLKSPISKVASVIHSEGLGLRATGRYFTK